MTTPDPLRRLAMDSLLLLPGQADPETPRARIDELPPIDRERAARIAARRLAFQLLYVLEVTSPPDVPAWCKATLAQVEGLGPLAAEQVVALASGAYEQRAAADEACSALAPDWPTHRQAAVDRAILRLAHYELAATPTPGAVIVNEAVELAKHFSTEKSPAFINGLLDKALHRLRPGGD